MEKYNDSYETKNTIMRNKTMAKTATQTVQKTIEKVTPIVKTTKDALVAMLANQVGSNIVTLTTKTDARLRKTGNPFGQVWKFSKVNCFIGVGYESCVNRQLDREDKEPDFVADKPQWGDYIPGTCLIEYNGKEYLPVLCKTVVGKIEFKDNDGNVLTKDQIAEFMPKRSTETRQGTDKPIEWRKYKIDSILGVTMNGTYYQIIV
jgi:hypothetical protein